MRAASLFPGAISRRRFLAQSLAASLVPSAFAQANPASPNPATPRPGFADHGVIKPPLSLPDLTVLRNNGVSATLQSIAANQVTALQLMFTTCTTTCPMQGATFERVQALIPDMRKRGIQLISLSVDPQHDTARALADWLAMFHGGPDWIGVAPAKTELATVKSFFGAGNSPLDPHSTRTSILDRSGRLVFRTYELPPPEQIVSILKAI